MIQPIQPVGSPQRSQQRAPQRQIIRTAENRFSVDEARIPADMSYEWKRVAALGQADEEHQINVQANGWTAVPAERHPELAGMKVSKDAAIVRGGLMLMERPKHLTDDARKADKSRADEQLHTQLQRVGQESRQAGVKDSFARRAGTDVVPD